MNLGVGCPLSQITNQPTFLFYLLLFCCVLGIHDLPFRLVWTRILLDLLFSQVLESPLKLCLCSTYASSMPPRFPHMGLGGAGPCMCVGWRRLDRPFISVDEQRAVQMIPSRLWAMIRSSLIIYPLRAYNEVKFEAQGEQVCHLSQCQ